MNYVIGRVLEVFKKKSIAKLMPKEDELFVRVAMFYRSALFHVCSISG